MSRKRLAQLFVALAALLLVAGLLALKLQDPTYGITEGMSIEEVNAALKGNAEEENNTFASPDGMVSSWRTRGGTILVYFKGNRVSAVDFTPDDFWTRLRSWLRL